MADPIPPGPPNGGWSAWLWLLYLAVLGWFGDWLRSRWQSRRPPPPPPTDHPHRRHDDYCDECHPEAHHHHRSSDENEEG